MSAYLQWHGVDVPWYALALDALVASSPRPRPELCVRLIGNAGPLWIENPLKFKKMKDASGSVTHVLVTAPCSHTPTDYPVHSAAGFHCTAAFDQFGQSFNPSFVYTF